MILGVTDEDLKRVLAENLTPSESIKTPERLFGREKNLRTIDRALHSPGRQIFIHGDRGVGKTSLALTAAYRHASAGSEPIHVLCSKSGTFADVIHAIGNASIPVKERVERRGEGAQFSLSVAGTGGGYKRSGSSTVSIAPPKSLNEALDIIRYVLARRHGTTVIIIDEMERLASNDDREKFAEFMKSLPELGAGIRFIFCGIAQDVTELLQSHPSAGRILETIKLDRLHHSDLWKILIVAAEKLRVELQRETLIRIGQVSDGFPHYVHLIGESLFWSMFDDDEVVKKSGAAHYKTGIEGAIQRTEATLRAQDDKATHKTRNTEDYEEALWALADSTSDRRQITEIYDTSYKWLATKRLGRKELTREQLNQRYLSLRKDSHGRIVVGFGSGWFAFRENIMRGYVRLRAEYNGIDLGRHHNTAGMD